MGASDTVIIGDVLDVARPLCVNLVFCSPPYEDARTYGMDQSFKGQAWVDWAIPRFEACLAHCNGLVAWVVEGRTRNYRYSCVPLLFMADLHRHGVHLRKPPAFNRKGIPGSGGPDWLRNDYEFIVCATNGGKLPWSDNSAMGAPCKYPVGGEMSNRTKDGRRRNARTDFPAKEKRGYVAPKKANPGNVIHLKVGGGLMGSDLAHENEAPFPEALAEFFIKSFCPPGGAVV